jgi:L-seryl-tRNA(Ser) seleniumtransferase
MEPLKQIPPVYEVLQAREVAEFRDILSRPFAKRIIDSVLAEVRLRLRESPNGRSRPELTAEIASEVARRIKVALQPSLRRVINASGVVLHTNLGRAPLPEGAIDHLRTTAAGYSNLEFDVDRNDRGKRDVHLEPALKELLACDAAIVVNNNAAAVLLVLNTLAEGGEVIVSRGEEIEIGESFRIPEIMTKSGARLREVGTTNRTRIEDYHKAIGENTRLLLRVHPSNFRILGFTQRPSLDEFVTLGRRANIPTYEDLGSGYINEIQSSGVTDEPAATASIRAGVDVISFSGDKLLGGPQAGIIAGKKEYIERIRRNPLFRTVRVDKLTITILEYVLNAFLRSDLGTIPIWRMLLTQESELKVRAEAFAGKAGPAVKAIQLKSVVGGGCAPETYIASWGVMLASAGSHASGMEKKLRSCDPPVIARVENDRVVLDFRTIAPAEEAELLKIVSQLGL